MEILNSKIINKENKNISMTVFSRKINPYEHLFTVYLFFVLFGPKIGLYIDTSIITSLLSLVILLPLNRKIAFHKKYFFYILAVFFILVYLFVVMLFTGNFLIVQVGRYLRSIISLISIWVVIISTKQRNETIVYSLVKVLSIHALLVLITSINIESQEILATFTGYNKKIRPLRSTGLMIGFDMSGLLCIVGYFLSFTYPYRHGRNFRVKLMMLLFLIATIFTSRFSILTLLIITALLVFKYRKKNYKRFEARIGLVFLILSSVPALILFISTTSFSGKLSNFLINHFPYFAGIVNRFVSSYADTDIGNTLAKHFDFSSMDVTMIIFGAAENANQDPGYTIIIYSIGVIGLLLSIIWYLRILFDTIKINEFFIRNRLANEETNNIHFTLIILVAITFAMSFKNNYFFTGTYFEILLIFISLSYKKYYEMRKLNET